MALKIRMARGGAKKRPYYHIVVTDERSPRDGRYIERIGSHNPFLDHDNPARVVLKLERVKYWLSVGAQPSERLQGFLAAAGLVEKKVRPTQTKKNQPKTKAQERMKEAAEKKAAAEQAAKEAAEAPAQEPVVAVEETPAEEPAPTEESAEPAAE